MVKGLGPAGLEGVADGADIAALGEVEKRAGDGRKQVGVLVGVEVG